MRSKLRGAHLSACAIRFLILISSRNAEGLAEVVTLSRSFLSSTAKAKTAKLSAALSLCLQRSKR